MILLKFTGSSVEKIYEIDVQKLRKEQKPKGFFKQASEPSGKITQGDYEQWLKTPFSEPASGMEAEAYFF